MRYDTQQAVVIGGESELNVIQFNGSPALETEFVQYDSELRAQDLRERGIDEFDFIKCEEFDEEYIDGHHDFRSVRIFHLATDEKIKLNPGDKISARTTHLYIAKEKTKDGRRKIHITVSHAKHVYRWTRHCDIKPPALVISLYCGVRKIKEKIIPITHKKGIQVINGRAYPMIAETFPNGSIMQVTADHGRSSVTTGDYRLAERQKGRTMQDIDKDFFRVPSYNRLVPTRDRKWHARYGIKV